jgi:hypothetical protein
MHRHVDTYMAPTSGAVRGTITIDAEASSGSSSYDHPGTTSIHTVAHAEDLSLASAGAL